MSTITTTISN